MGATRGSDAWSAGVYGWGIGNANAMVAYSESGYGVKAFTEHGGTAVYGDNTNTAGFAGKFNGNVTVTGKLGIGESNPQAQLHVKGDAIVGGRVHQAMIAPPPRSTVW